jgi:uncharacterized membrane protein
VKSINSVVVLITGLLAWDYFIIIGTWTFISSMGSGRVNNNMDMETDQLLTGLGTRYLHLGQS